jgi:hypothetical protein
MKQIEVAASIETRTHQPQRTQSNVRLNPIGSALNLSGQSANCNKIPNSRFVRGPQRQAKRKQPAKFMPWPAAKY